MHLLLLISFPALNPRGDTYEKRCLRCFCPECMVCTAMMEYSTTSLLAATGWTMGSCKLLPERVGAISEFPGAYCNTSHSVALEHPLATV